VLEFARARWPLGYARARRLLALAAYGSAAVRTRLAPESAYREFWQVNARPDYWQPFADLLLRSFRPRSVADVGCGSGGLLAALQHADPSLRLFGTDASSVALGLARGEGLDARYVDIARMSAAERAGLTATLQEFDLVVCLEMAEHIPAWHAERLTKLLAAADLLIFSAAQPNQGGVLHVNEQPPEYWFTRLARHGLQLDARDAEFRAQLAQLAMPPWYAANTHLFTRNSPAR
jgi:SAM-dependent methyltransferase